MNARVKARMKARVKARVNGRRRLPIGALTRLAVGDLRAEPLRSVLAVVVLVPVAASWFLLAAVADSLGTLGRTGDARNVVVTEQDVFDLSNIRLGSEQLTAATEAAGDDAESVSALVMRVVELDDRVLQLRASEPALWGAVYGLQLVEGRLPDPAADEMAVTSAVRLSTGWDVGTRQRVFGTEFTITAVMEGSGTKIASLWLPLTRAEVLFDRPGEFQMAVVRVRADADGDAVRDRLRAALPGLLVLEESAIQAEATRGVRSLADLARIFTAIGIVGLAVGCANTTALTLAERARSVGLLRVIGFGPGEVRRLLSVRASILTAAALVVGLAAAWPAVASQKSFVLRSYTIAPHLEPLPVAAGCVLSLASAWLGAALASRRALRRPAGELLDG